MSLPPVIDVDALLAPISDGQPGGVDPRDNSSVASPYFRVKDARNAARAEERAALEADAPISDTWYSVVNFGADLLTKEAKDLEVATWMTEALMRTEGFVGLRDGLTLISRLVETFWDHLFPLPDEDGLEAKVSSVAGLNGVGATGTLERPIRNVALTNGSNGAYSFWVYEQAVELEKITDSSRRAARIADGTVTLEEFRKSVADTPIEALRDTLSTVGECETALAAMSAALDNAAGVDAPSMMALQDLLAAVGGCLRHVAADRLAALAQATAAAESAESGAASLAASADGSSASLSVVRRPGEFANREEALVLLTQIMTYFRRTEPHSPISYTIEDAVRRARLPLPELLKELAQDPTHMQYILLSAGVRYEEPENQSY